MTLIVCVEKYGGISYKNESIVTSDLIDKDIREMLGTNAKFIKTSDNNVICHDLGSIDRSLKSIQSADYCLSNGNAANTIIDFADELIIYRLKDNYPADVRIKFIEKNWTKNDEIKIDGILGKITKELYSRNPKATPHN